MEGLFIFKPWLLGVSILSSFRFTLKKNNQTKIFLI
jgi:hypothetical protein